MHVRIVHTHPKPELVVVVVWTMYDMTMCVIKQWKKAPWQSSNVQSQRRETAER